ncbi:putative endo/exonuclease Mre11 [Trypanosoma rangeli]|uniref:Putative endo/exonuclease Mre11 n=1 Tax=Trypanosoma rangeli TaxID=5698 RepID=A0A422NJT3_TRYRA|nr:putative endo/exonuclease Mre11 [Trypanosoma rangeli]RNF05726.1 putative endo/exonuclease Mre11 [Trypanosoma rangeli]|eukprot:RNF05726.1 putative endo/exonuclease Mre11 [Trypanosoma rangeli]
MAGAGDAAPSSSTFKFLITTDNHLGYQERDPRRGNDSFTTFEECLRAARVEHDVDAILLGGDLFHDNKPSLGCLARTTSLLRTYVLGDKPIAFSLLSDPKRNFPTHPVPLANFQDPNINVATPIFTIHGNHDDPVGGTSSIDILAANGLVNYFGQVSSLDDIVVEPVLLKKGHTYVALYGLGNVRDERLHRCFRMKKLRFVHPKPVAGRRWFKIFLLHQNRGVRGGPGEKAGIFESMLADLGLDVVIWGNEHEQQMVPTPSEGFDIIQPGSTILTSLSGQECNPKQYGVLEVRDGSYRLTPFLLRSVRPVVRRTVELWRENPAGRTLDAVEDFLRRVIEEMIEEAEVQVSRIPDDVLAFHPSIKFPLMRLSVDFTDPESTNFPQPNINRFGQQYMDVVVNPGDLLRPIKPKTVIRRLPPAPGGDGMATVVPVPLLNTSDIRTKVAEVFNANARDACSLLSEPEVSAAVYAFAEKGERDAIDERINELLNKCQKSVWKAMGRGDAEGILVPDSIYSEVVRYKQDINKRYAEATRAGEALQQGGERQLHQSHEHANDAQTGRMSSGFTIVDAFDGSGVPLGAPSSSTALTLNTAAPCALRRVFDADDDALPDTGLERGTLSALIANAVKQDQGVGAAAAPCTVAVVENGRAKRQREEVEVVVVDDDATEVHTVQPLAKRGARRMAAGTAAAPAPKPARGKRGKQAAASSLIPTPTLQLTHQPVPGEFASQTLAAKPETSKGALNYLSKWASSN